MHVEVVAEQLCAPVPGGTGRYTEGLIRGLVASGQPGLDRVRLTATSDLPGVHDLGLDLRRLPVPHRVLSRLWERGLPPLVGGRDVDVVHAPTLLVPGRWRARHLAVTIHDVVPWTHPETLTPRGVAFHRRMAERAAVAADLIVTPSEAVAHEVRSRLSPRGEVAAIPPGCAFLPLPHDASARRHQVGVIAEGYVLFVGTAEPRKGLDLLVRAMAQTPGLTLVHVGPRGWGEVDVAALAASAGISERVVLAGRVDDATLAALYAGAAALALPSRAEGFGLPVLEAMAAGIPVITSDDPALVEAGGGHAVVVPVGDVDALAAGLRSVTGAGRPEASRLAAARAHAATFTWPGFGSALRAAYSMLG